MHLENLVKMANQIGTFYESLPDRETGIASVASHLTRFWEPRMRRELIAHVERGGHDLLPIVAAGVKRLTPVLETR